MQDFALSVANLLAVALGVDDVRAGDPGGGFDDHYAALYRPLVQYCRQMTQYADPEDLAQEAMVRAWPRYVEGREMWPLVVTIARRLAIDAYRRSLRGEVRNHVEAAYRQSAAPTPEEVLERHEEGLMARRALAELSPRYQRMLRLRDIDERSYTDIAQLEGTSLDVARSTLRRARAALRAAYWRASEGAAAVLGLRGWAARRSGRTDATLGQLAQQGLPTLAGAIVVIAMAAGISGSGGSSTLRTTPSPPSADAVGASRGGHARGALPSLAGHSGTGAGAGTGSASPVPGKDVVRPDRIVGPVGLGGEDYRKAKTKDAEVQIELNIGDQVLVGVYTNPKAFLADPAQPIEDKQ